MASIVRTRFAPSPTGSLHVGGARTALYCMLYAHHHDGQFVLRIEDTDRARSTEEATLGIIRDLRWLGIEWDEGPGAEDGGPHGPYYQSKRLHLYDRYVEQLLEAGHAYLAWDSRDELDAMRDEAQAAKRTFKYRRPDWSDDDIARFKREGRVPVVRMHAPLHAVTVDDTILGPVTVTPEDLDDIVIRKADGFPTYHFAVVIDDYLMEITQVLRGQEHLLNTHKHLGIFEALGWEAPSFGHMPIIFNPGGGKMSKRDKAKAARDAARLAREARKAQGLAADDWAWLAELADLSEGDIALFMKKKNDRVSIAQSIARALDVELPLIEVMDFRTDGFLPEALLNYLALLGWSPGDDREVMTMAEMEADFSLERVNNTAARFDPDKLRWMNGEYMRNLPIERLQEALALYLEVVDSPLEHITAVQRRQILELYRERAHTFGEMEKMARFLFERPTAWDANAAKKHLIKGDGLDRLRSAGELMASVSPWDAPSIHAAIETWCSERELGMGKIAQPLRVAVSGTAVSPPIAETLELLTQEEVVARCEACHAYVTTYAS